MEKVIRDGEVAVLYSPSHTAGWYSWHDRKELLFDPYVVNIVLEHREKHPRAKLPSRLAREIIRYGKEQYESAYCEAAYDLEVHWLPVGTEFRIEEYDGAESVVMKDEYEWVTA